MISKIVKYKSKIEKSDFYEAESIERKIEIAETSNIPIEAVSPILYTEEKDGVLAGTNIRTDKWDIALEAYDKINKTNIVKNEEPIKQKENETSN